MAPVLPGELLSRSRSSRFSRRIVAELHAVHRRLPDGRLVPSPGPDRPIRSIQTCISYFTISCEPRFPVRSRGNRKPCLVANLSGCCPWNARSPVATDPISLAQFAPPLETLACLTEEEFRNLFRAAHPAIAYSGFLRTSQWRWGTRARRSFASVLKLAQSTEPMVPTTRAGLWSN